MSYVVTFIIVSLLASASIEWNLFDYRSGIVPFTEEAVAATGKNVIYQIYLYLVLIFLITILFILALSYYKPSEDIL